MHLEEVSNVDDEALRPRFDGDPLIVNLHLQADNIILVKNGEEMRVSVSSEPNRKLGLGARRIQVEAHGSHGCILEVMVQTRRQ